jgi:hypothetical protein
MDRKKLKLVARLAEFGEAGEREAAKYILAEHGVTARELLGESESEKDEIFVEIPFKTKEERRIIIQNYSRIMNVDVVESWKRPRSITFGVPSDLSADFRETCEILKKQWRRDLEVLLSAFIQKNQLFSDLPTINESGLSPEEIHEILSIARALQQVHLGKLLEE